MRVACRVKVCVALGGPVHTRVLLSDLSRASGEECPAASCVPLRSWDCIKCLEVTVEVPCGAVAWRGVRTEVRMPTMCLVGVLRLDGGLYALIGTAAAAGDAVQAAG